MQVEVAVVSISEVQELYYCMCTCKWRQLWSLLQKFRDCITACVHANGGSCGRYFRSSGTVLLHVYMQMEVAVVATSEVQGLFYCMCTCKWYMGGCGLYFRSSGTVLLHVYMQMEVAAGRYFRSSGTVLLHVYMQIDVAVVSTSEVQVLYYCMCTCKWRQLWSLLQKFRDCITACVHANGGSTGRYFRQLWSCYFRSSGTVLLHVYMQMEVSLWTLHQKFRDCFTACVHANECGCGLYFRSSGTVLLHVYMQMKIAVDATSKVQVIVLLHVYMQMEVAVVSTSEVQGLYYCMCTCKWRVSVVTTSEVQGLYQCMCICKWRQLWSLLQKFRDCITACVHANGGSCGRYFRSSGTVLLHVYMQMEVAVVATSEVQGLYYCMCTCKWRQLWSLLQKFRDCITACVHANEMQLWSLHQKFRYCITACVDANGGSYGLLLQKFRDCITACVHANVGSLLVATSEVQGLYYCMCTCKWRQLWSLLQKFRDCITACVHANGGSLWTLLQKFGECFTACVHANGGSYVLYFRSSGTVLLHVYMQMKIAVDATSKVQGLYYCMCTCKWRQLQSTTSEVQGLYYCMCTCKWRQHCGLYFRSSGTVLLHVYMQMAVAVVSTSEVQGLYYCMCTCKWRQPVDSLLQKFSDCVTTCVHANGGSCGRYFRSSGTVLLHVYMQMEVAVVSTSEVKGLYYCMCTCKWMQLQSLLQKFRDCITACVHANESCLWSLLQKFRVCISACVHANGGSCGLYFRSSGTVLLHVYMQMEVAVVATSEVQELYYCMCTCKWRQLWSLLQKFRDCIYVDMQMEVYFRSSGTVLMWQMDVAVVSTSEVQGTVLLHVYMKMEVAVVEVQGLYYCMCTCGGGCGLYFRSSGTVLLHVYMQMEVAVVATSEVQGLYYCMCTCKWRQLQSLLQNFRDCITACVHANGGSLVSTSEVQGLYYCMCTCKCRWLWSLLQKFRDCITACVHANGGSCGLYFRSSGTVLLHVYMQMEVAVVAKKFRNCITACVHANGGSCGRYFRSSGTVLLHVYMQMEVAVVSTSEVQGLYYCMCNMQMELAMVVTSEVQGQYYCMCTCKWRQLWSLLQKFRDCITACVHANEGSCGLYFKSSGTVLLHVYMQMQVAVVSTSEFLGLYYCRDCITACVHANGGSCGLYFRSSGTVLLHVYMEMEVAVVPTSEVQRLYYCMCTCKWRWLWSLLQNFRDCITACEHANGVSYGVNFRSSGTVLLHVNMQMEVAVVSTS